MFDFENKPIKDWTLAECKEYCKNTHHKGTCTNYKDSLEYCVLAKNNICRFAPSYYDLSDIPEFTPDEIAFFRLIKKTCPWANYIVRTSCYNIFYTELIPKFNEDKTYFIIGTTGKYTQINNNFFPQIEPLTYYAISDIIKQEEKS